MVIQTLRRLVFSCLIEKFEETFGENSMFAADVKKKRKKREREKERKGKKKEKKKKKMIFYCVYSNVLENYQTIVG